MSAACPDPPVQTVGIWNTTTANPVVLVRDIDHPETVQTVSLVNTGSALLPIHMTQNGSGHVFDVSWPINTNMRVATPMPTSVTVTDQSVPARPDSVRRTTVHLPAQGQVYEATPSPDNTRMAWLLLYGVQPSPYLRPLYVLAPFLRESLRPKLGLWISNRDGSDMTELGNVKAFEKRTIGFGDFPISHVQWLPDGKHLSYLYHDGLYTVDAP